ncbi:MAG: hypothetical protein LWW78_04490 [Deltaproteobacteria bacterium]|nr:hypothetical protein [Deltaproteobacteria bacterium]
MHPGVKFAIRLGSSYLGALILTHFFRFLGKGRIITIVLTIFLLITAYGLEWLRGRRLD